MPQSQLEPTLEPSPDRQARLWGAYGEQLESCRSRVPIDAIVIAGHDYFPVADDPLGSKLVLGRATQVSFPVFGFFEMRRIINPAVRTENITILNPKENDPPVREYT